jgi:hypothetical protein
MQHFPVYSISVLLLIHVQVAEADCSLEVIPSILYRYISLTVSKISAHFIDTDHIIQKCLLRSKNCGDLRGKIIFTMFLLTFPLLRLNILILPSESAKKKRTKEYVNKEAQQDGKVSFYWKKMDG